MELSGVRELGASRAVVWDVLQSPAEMAGLVPGVESFEIVDEQRWTAQVKVPIGVGGLKMKMSFEQLEQRPPEHAGLRAKGNGVGAIVSMETSFDLDELGDLTSMRWHADVKIAGRVGSMGARVLQPIVNQQVENVLRALDARVQAVAGGAAPA